MAIDRRHRRETGADTRSGKITSVTAGLGEGHVQANLAVLPKDYAYDFLLFCQRNPRPCPLIEVTDVGSPEPTGVAPGADLRTDLPRYRIYKDGGLADEVTDASPYWRDDLVAFLLGCSFPFEGALLEAGVDPGRGGDRAGGGPRLQASVHAHARPRPVVHPRSPHRPPRGVLAREVPPRR